MTRSSWTYCLLAALLCAGAAAQEPRKDSGDSMARDTALWQSVRQVTAQPQLRPGGWHVTRDPATGASFAAPCEWQHSEKQQGAVTAQLYQCARGSRAYIVVVIPNPAGMPVDTASNATLFQHFAVSNDSSMMAGFERAGLNPRLTPVMRLQYQGMVGRQHTITTTAFDVQVRTLHGEGGFVNMTLRDAPGNFPGDADSFFNSLKMN